MASTINIALDDYIGDIDDVDLAVELRRRGYSVYAPPAKLEALKRIDKRPHGVESDHNPSLEDGLRAIRAAIVERRTADAVAIADRLLAPRFKDIEHCKAAYAQTRKAAA